MNEIQKKMIKKIMWPHIYTLIVFFILNTISMYADTDGWEGFQRIDNYLIFDALYYTIITHTTVGYGDILPRWRYWKMMGALHSLIVFFLIINEISDISIKKLFKQRKRKKKKKKVKKLNDIQENNEELSSGDVADDEKDTKTPPATPKIVHHSEHRGINMIIKDFDNESDKYDTLKLKLNHDDIYMV